MKIKCENIIPDPNQPRKTFDAEQLRELRGSLDVVGLIQPITVRPTKEGRYIIVVGERRYRASVNRGDIDVECNIREDIDGKTAREMQFAENYCFEPLNAYEQAEAWAKHIREYNMTAVMFSKSIGVRDRTVLRNLALVNHLHPDLKQAILDGRLTKSHAEEIAPISNPERQVDIANQIINGNIGGRKADEFIKYAKNAPNRTPESIVAQIHFNSDRDKLNYRDVLNESKRQRVGNVPLPEGKYSTIILDPPWAIEKILRKERPNQFDIDYPTWTIEEIMALPLQTLAENNGCHIYLWTTHKYLPIAFDVLEAWGAKYQCLLTWVKNVGMTPFSWMYSTEHCLFARIGELNLLKMGKRLDFNGKVREHSRKPDEFYDLVREVSPEPRIDMFGREPHDGFEVWGNEPNKFKPRQVLSEE